MEHLNDCILDAITTIRQNKNAAKWGFEIKYSYIKNGIIKRTIR